MSPVTAVVGLGCVSAASIGVVRTTSGTGDTATFTVSTPIPEIDFAVLHLSRPLLDPPLTPVNPPMDPLLMPTPPAADCIWGPNVGTNAPGRPGR